MKKSDLDNSIGNDNSSRVPAERIEEGHEEADVMMLGCMIFSAPFIIVCGILIFLMVFF